MTERFAGGRVPASGVRALCTSGLVLVFLAGCAQSPASGRGAEAMPTLIEPEMDTRIAAIGSQYVFADMHAHPSRFHRANVPMVSAEEVDNYKRRHMDLVVATVSSDAPYSGRYWLADGTEVPRGQYKPEPGAVFAMTVDRLARLQATIDAGLAVHASGPEAVRAAKANGRLAILPAIEGADALEGELDNLYALHGKGLRLIQLVHFRNNELGHHQSWPYSPGGLTEFGEQVVRASNELGLVIDLAHCNEQTIADVLALSAHPVIFSHGGLKALLDQDRALTDDQVRAIAARGGVVGIWPNGRYIEDVPRMVDYIGHVIAIAGPDHVGIGSDLRGMSRYSDGFTREAEFRAIAREMLRRGYDDDTVGKVMGGNFFRVWEAVSAARES